MNEQIRISPIRLIGAEGEQHGIVPTVQALEMARDIGMDLVEIAAQERPPVCKIMDYGKHKYEQSKKQHQKTHQQKLKELRVRPKTGDHDIETRVNQALKFFEHGDKVLLRVQFRGREMQHIEEGRRVMDQMLEALLDHCKLEKPPSMEGKQMTALLAPKGSASQPKPKPKPKPPSEPRKSGDGGERASTRPASDSLDPHATRPNVPSPEDAAVHQSLATAHGGEANPEPRPAESRPTPSRPVPAPTSAPQARPTEPRPAPAAQPRSAVPGEQRPLAPNRPPAPRPSNTGSQGSA